MKKIKISARAADLLCAGFAGNGAGESVQLPEIASRAGESRRFAERSLCRLINVGLVEREPYRLHRYLRPCGYALTEIGEAVLDAEMTRRIKLRVESIFAEAGQ